MAIEKGAGYRDYSNAIAQNAISQPVMDDNIERQSFFLKNIDAADTLWVQFGGKAVQDIPSIPLAPGDQLVMDAKTDFIDPRAVFIVGPNAGAKFLCREA